MNFKKFNILNLIKKKRVLDICPRSPYTIIKKNSDMKGLKYIPHISDADDDIDAFSVNVVEHEFSLSNRTILEDVIKKIKPKAILEIGVQRKNALSDSSTGVFLKNKTEDCVYIGVDIENKSHLDDENKKIFTIQLDSGLHEKIIRKIRSLGVNTLDLIFIDGFHSINQVVKEWKYTELLSKNGAVVLHDTNMHPGPKHVFDAVDETLYSKTKYCTSENDHGIAVIYKK